MAGVVLGLAVADVLIHFIGTGAPQLAVLIVLAMSAAVLLNGSELVISEAAVSAMLLVMVGPTGGGFSPNRVLEAIIGGAVALAVALLFPPQAGLHRQPRRPGRVRPARPLARAHRERARSRRPRPRRRCAGRRRARSTS